jgi:hypothetical protein
MRLSAVTLPVATGLTNEANRVRSNESTIIDIATDKPMNLCVLADNLRKVWVNRALANAPILLARSLVVVLRGLLFAAWIALGLAFAIVCYAEMLGVIQFD